MTRSPISRRAARVAVRNRPSSASRARPGVDVAVSQPFAQRLGGVVEEPDFVGRCEGRVGHRGCRGLARDLAYLVGGALQVAHVDGADDVDPRVPQRPDGGSVRPKSSTRTTAGLRASTASTSISSRAVSPPASPLPAVSPPASPVPAVSPPASPVPAVSPPASPVPASARQPRRCRPSARQPRRCRPSARQPRRCGPSARQPRRCRPGGRG